jgi:hypothetical protein
MAHELRSAIIASLLTALLTVTLTNFLYWQPQLELLSEQIDRPKLLVSLLPESGWRAIDTKDCAIIQTSPHFRFQITNIGHEPLHLLRIILNATNWNHQFTHDFGQLELQSGEVMTITLGWSDSPTGSIAAGQGELSVTVVAVGCVQTSNYCIFYTEGGAGGEW